jgi:hypothetical protein
MGVTNVYAEILKSERDENGDLIVTGRATSDDLDGDQQRCDPTWLKTAMPEWFKFGNVREQHGKNAAGVAETLENDGNAWIVTTRVTDPIAAHKVETKTYKGYSIGIKDARVVKDAAAPNGRIINGRIVEISLVDRPCNPTCTLELAKAATPGMKVKGSDLDRERMLVKSEKLVDYPENVDAEPVEDLDKEVEITEDDLVKFEEFVAEKRDVPEAERKQLADKGQALPDGSFPVASVSDLKNAIRAIGRAKDPAKAKAHIKRRAKALGKPELIPDSWKDESADAEKALHDSSDLAAIRQGLVGCIQAELDELCNGEDEAWDIQQLMESLCTFLCWWEGEALEGETESPNMEASNVTHVTMSDDGEKEKTETVDVNKADEVDRFKELEDKFTKSLEASQERYKALEAELNKVKALPVPGGPVLTKTQVDVRATRVREAQSAQADHYEHLAKTVNDRELSSGYLELARMARNAL